MSILRFHLLRVIGAFLVLLLAVLYLLGYEELAVICFFPLCSYAALLCNRIRRGKQPAFCDICGSSSFLKVEYEHGFINVRLVLECPHCGRVVNTASHYGIKAGVEKKIG